MALRIPVIDCRRDLAEAELRALRRQLSPRGDVVSEAGRQRTVEVFGEPLTPDRVVERICRDVAARGVAAVLDYTAKLDGKPLQADELRVPPERLAKAHAKAEPRFLDTVRAVRERVHQFQVELIPSDVRVERSPGVVLEHRYVPLQRVGICVPGGAAAYPSTVLMTAVPAQAAAVREIVIVAPPTPFGAENDDVLAVCHELGIDAVYRIGGAQAVAAMAYGIEGLEPVDKIVGPGNLFVALAKKYVFGEVDIDSIAGPSEVVVLADDSVDPDWIAYDLLAQAEHSPGASILVTWQESVLEGVRGSLERLVPALDRSELTRQSLESYGRLVLADDLAQACQLAASLAPEHLHLQMRNARECLSAIPTAGAVFIGPYSPVALGDYIAGPSHVLPTGGTARFASGLSATSFLRSHSVIEYSAEGLATESQWVADLATREGLTAHRDSVLIRRPST